MAYATLEDLVAAFGEEEILAISDREHTGQVGVTVALEALDRASSEADSYLAARYSLPLAEVSPALRQSVCDIARYRLTGGTATETEVISNRYKLAVAWLRDISAGRAVLPGARPPEAGGTGGVQIHAGTRDWLPVPPDEEGA